MNERGTISVNSENIMPIIKKWLYSDRDIFIREMVSNATDAITKYKKVVSLGEAKETDTVYKIVITVNPQENTLTFWDNGIGMTADEVRKYINQVAFSGAADFIQKYEKEGTGAEGIIGHFGLGFYSAFMVADKVTINTLSYQDNAEAVLWESDGSTEYEMTTGTREKRGTTITLYLSQDSLDFADTATVRQVLNKYCAFIPYPIYLEEVKKEEKEQDKEKTELKPINDSNPLWLKNPADCTEEEYKEFYQKVFFDFNPPLFWIHLNVDYPFKLKGILYFPKLTENIDSMQGQIKLYNNQVYVADNIKEITPEFLMLLKGVIDCPDMPLNVSRSFLQNDGTIRKINQHITKKVADKLTGMFESSREEYNSYWDDIGIFIKYGCMRDDKFYDRMKDCLIYKTTNDDYCLLKDYLERNKDKHENKVFYITNKVQQAQYIRMFKDSNLEALYLEGVIDQPFINFIESKNPEIKFWRIDSNIADALKAQGQTPDLKELCKEFKDLLNDNNTEVKAEHLSTNMPAILLLDEQNRRLQDMSKYYSGVDLSEMFPSKYTLVLNSNNKLIEKLGSMEASETKNLLMQQVYDLAALANVPLTPERMSAFIDRSATLLEQLAEK